MWSNIAPRAGCRWDPTGDGRTSVRAGFGITERLRDRDRRSSTRAQRRRTAWNSASPARLFDDPWGSVGQDESVPRQSPRTTLQPARCAPLFITGAVRHQDDAEPQLERRDSAAVRDQARRCRRPISANHMVNVWGIVDGNPAVIPRRRVADRSLRSRRRAGGSQTFAELSTRHRWISVASSA